MAKKPEVFRHLCHIGHAAEHNCRIGKAPGKPERPRGRACLWISIRKQRNHIGMRRSERAAAHGLHNDAGNPAGRYHFILLFGTLGCFPIVVIDLELNEIPICRFQNFAQNLRRVMEGKAGIADDASRLLGENKINQTFFFANLPVFLVQVMQQVIVEIGHARAPEGSVQQFLRRMPLREQPHGELICKIEALAWVAFYQSALHSIFRISIPIYIGGVKVIDSACNAGVHQLFRF